MAEMTVRVEGEIELSPDATVSIDSSQILSTRDLANETSLHVAGSVANPTAGTTICTMTPPAGFYRIDIARGADGSGTPTLYNNASFRVGATDHVLVQLPVLGYIYQYTFWAGVDGSTAMSIVSPAASSPNITVTASITATRYA